MSDELEKLRAANEELREDVRNMMGMMTNVVALLLELDIAYDSGGRTSEETSERFQSAAGVYYGYTQKKILDVTSDIVERMAAEEGTKE